jgi:hypothetical protein
MEQRMTKCIFIALLIIVTFLGFDCKKNPIAPPDNNGTDTTSHNWVFTVDTLGDGNGSILKDVTILNTNPPLAYAVGDIELKDSTGQFEQKPYCLAKWNGLKWDLTQLKFFPPGAIGDSLNAIGDAVFANGPNDIWMAAGALFHWFGSRLDVNYNTGAEGANKIWSDHNGNCWFVCNTGAIIQYTNGTWQKLSSGTSTDMQDIWGYQNNSEQTTILCISSTVFYGGTENLFSISGNNVTQLNTNGLSWSIRGIWFDDNGYYIVGAEIYYKKSLRDSVWQIIKPAPSSSYGYVNAIRGNSANDIVAVGAFGTFLHYNGSSWYNFTQQLNLSGCDFYSVSIKDNLVVAVGTLGGDRAIAVVGVRK